MKKKYIKPLMESEMFIPNEYCKVCEYVTCTDNPSHGSFIYRSETGATDGLTIFDSKSFKDDGFDRIVNDGWFYDREINGHKGTHNINDEYGLYGYPTEAHKVDVTKINQDNYEALKKKDPSLKFGPNAS